MVAALVLDPSLVCFRSLLLALRLPCLSARADDVVGSFVGCGVRWLPKIANLLGELLSIGFRWLQKGSEPLKNEEWGLGGGSWFVTDRARVFVTGLSTADHYQLALLLLPPVKSICRNRTADL